VWEVVQGSSTGAERRKARIRIKELRISNSTNEPREINMLWTIFVVLLILWLLGFSLHVAGGLIHLLLVVALVVLVINLMSGRRIA
jgi:hypothetical protein